MPRQAMVLALQLRIYRLFPNLERLHLDMLPRPAASTVPLEICHFAANFMVMLSPLEKATPQEIKSKNRTAEVCWAVPLNFYGAALLQ